MKLGLIGYPLGHSWSPAIHRIFLNEDCYELMPLMKDELDTFFARRDFDGINVTIPYKQEVMKYLDEIDEAAQRIGAINCIVNKNGRLYGYNTDYVGFKDMVEASSITVANKKIAVLGSGGASKAVVKALEVLSAEPVVISRTKKDGCITYEQLIESEEMFSGIVNTTPVGMSPNDEETPVNLDYFTKLEFVIDIVANPLRTSLIFEAQNRGLKTLGGFEMLVRQAFAADRYFTGSEMDQNLIPRCINQLLKKKRSVVLIGMPTSGKSTISKLLAEKTGRNLVEMDEEIERRLGTTIKECFQTKGESYFRSIESQLAKDLKNAEDSVISTGGGIIKNSENMRILSENGIVLWIDRRPEQLFGSSDRPLSQNKEDISRLYEERKDLYNLYADYVIDNNGSIEEAMLQILKILGE